MNRFTYYSPLWLGALISLTLHETIAQTSPGLPESAYWWFVGAVCVALGGACQLTLIGAQGAFAQVLPVPGGRSIRGAGAKLGGWMLMLGLALSAAGALLISPESAVTSRVAFVGAAACLVVCGIAYAWSWPTAEPDFAEPPGKG